MKSQQSEAAQREVLGVQECKTLKFEMTEKNEELKHIM
jgi:hypothetical protein